MDYVGLGLDHFFSSAIAWSIVSKVHQSPAIHKIRIHFDTIAAFAPADSYHVPWQRVTPTPNRSKKTNKIIKKFFISNLIPKIQNEFLNFFSVRFVYGKKLMWKIYRPSSKFFKFFSFRRFKGKSKMKKIRILRNNKVSFFNKNKNIKNFKI